MKYEVEVALYAIQSDTRITDIRLARGLDHSDSCVTPLLSIYNHEDNEYTLRICGNYTISYLNSGMTISQDLNDQQIRMLEAKESLPVSVPIAETLYPYFEWIDQDGTPVGEVFDSISLTADEEAAKFLACLNNQRETEKPINPGF
jgi:hypothetical protein